MNIKINREIESHVSPPIWKVPNCHPLAVLAGTRFWEGRALHPCLGEGTPFGEGRALPPCTSVGAGGWGLCPPPPGPAKALPRGDGAQPTPFGIEATPTKGAVGLCPTDARDTFPFPGPGLCPGPTRSKDGGLGLLNGSKSNEETLDGAPENSKKKLKILLKRNSKKLIFQILGKFIFLKMKIFSFL